MDRWQPIPTAPKDGRQVDLWQNGRLTNCAWYPKGLEAVGQNGGTWLGAGGVMIVAPTHWMPVPAPPITLLGDLPA